MPKPYQPTFYEWDFTLYYHCSTADLREWEYPHSEGKNVVTVHSGGNLSCTCRAYKADAWPKECAHTKDVLTRRCMWHALKSANEHRTVAGQPVCPECGAAAVVKFWAI